MAPRGMDIWSVEGIASTIFFYLDLSTFDALSHFIQAVPELRTYLSDGTLWTQLSQNRDWSWTSRELTCVQLQEFLQSLDDRKRFDELVTVLSGDIQHIKDIDGQLLDGIAFPTNPHLTNHHVGAAAVVFARAGHALDGFIRDPSFRGVRPVGSVVVTPDFEAGVSKLIHCVGPSIHMENCYELLSTTYRRAMEAMLREGLQCVIVASVSTGSLGVPPKEGGLVAMRAI
ncbi:Macro domain [Phytophthora infestans]|uniref:Macro domain n=1 Tax=Phytophthora infestans TaxID=4787 RepID=A0A8S9V0Z7_PHYIN|nr:Macro domain [Phytophthora infestans]